MNILQSIVVFRLSSLGDVLLAIPLLRSLRRSFPAARIAVVCSSRYSEALQGLPYFDSLHEVVPELGMGGLLALRRVLLAENGGKFDAAVDLQRNVRTVVLRTGIAKRLYLSPKFRLQKLLAVHLKSYSRSLPHVVERYFSAVASLGVAADGLPAEYRLPAEQSLPAPKRPASGLPVVAIAPGARHATKRWTEQGFATTMDILAEKTGATFLLIGGKDDAAVCERVLSLTHTVAENVSGAATLAESVRRLDEADILIANDSGAMHLASARNIPVVAIYGSTVPSLGFSPYNIRSRIVEAQLGCRPCTHIGRSDCPEKHFRCMKDIQAETVAAAAMELLDEGRWVEGKQEFFSK